MCSIIFEYTNEIGSFGSFIGTFLVILIVKKNTRWGVFLKLCKKFRSILWPVFTIQQFGWYFSDRNRDFNGDRFDVYPNVSYLKNQHILTWRLEVMKEKGVHGVGQSEVKASGGFWLHSKKFREENVYVNFFFFLKGLNLRNGLHFQKPNTDLPEIIWIARNCIPKIPM